MRLLHRGQAPLPNLTALLFEVMTLTRKSKANVRTARACNEFVFEMVQNSTLDETRKQRAQELSETSSTALSDILKSLQKIKFLVEGIQNDFNGRAS